VLEFPTLRTGVAGQYPLRREVLAEIRVYTFLDGRQQRFPAAKLRRRWTLQLDLLDEEEAWAVEEFARQHFETAEPFRFTDPQTGTVHWPCYLLGKSFATDAKGPKHRGCTLVVIEGEA
jgi:hypothetical protein